MCGYSVKGLWSRIQPNEYHDHTTQIAKDRKGSTLGKVTILLNFYFIATERMSEYI